MLPIPFEPQILFRRGAACVLLNGSSIICVKTEFAEKTWGFCVLCFEIGQLEVK
jgi:hypothetical protein